jgi:hypothetical protein
MKLSNKLNKNSGKRNYRIKLFKRFFERPTIELAKKTNCRKIRRSNKTVRKPFVERKVVEQR